MIHNPIDAAVYASPQLSEFIKMRVNDPDVDHPLTLVQVHDYLADLLSESFPESELMHHFDDGESLLDELDGLIEEYGPGALADDPLGLLSAARQQDLRLLGQFYRYPVGAGHPFRPGDIAGAWG